MPADLGPEMEAPPLPPPLPMGGMMELPVPVASLAQPDDTEQMQTPAEGDTVTLQVEATVVRIDGETAYIKPLSVNGNPIADEAAEVTPDNEAAEGEALRGMAANMM